MKSNLTKEQLDERLESRKPEEAQMQKWFDAYLCKLKKEKKKSDIMVNRRTGIMFTRSEFLFNEDGTEIVLPFTRFMVNIYTLESLSFYFPQPIDYKKIDPDWIMFLGINWHFWPNPIIPDDSQIIFGKGDPYKCTDKMFLDKLADETGVIYAVHHLDYHPITRRPEMLLDPLKEPRIYENNGMSDAINNLPEQLLKTMDAIRQMSDEDNEEEFALMNKEAKEREELEKSKPKSKKGKRK